MTCVCARCRRVLHKPAIVRGSEARGPKCAAIIARTVANLAVDQHTLWTDEELQAWQTAVPVLREPAPASRRRDIDPGQIPIGSIVRTPLGLEAEVIRYFSDGRRGHRDRLVCRYLQPKNRRYAVATLVPELVTVIRIGGTP